MVALPMTMDDVGEAEDETVTGITKATEAPTDNGPGTTQVIGPAVVPVQPTGRDATSTVVPARSEYVTVAEAALDGPLLWAVKVTTPEVPGVITGVLAVTDRSAEPDPTVTVEAASLLGSAGSAVAEDDDAKPPDRVAPGVAPAGTASGTVSSALPVAASGPVRVQVIVPVKGPVQPLGNDVMVTPVGAV